ncbi:MAG: DUF4177 domain-containing protein [Pseudomonadota bacterium]
MPRYEYKVVPAPTKGLKARGVKGTEARFSFAIETLMNDLAAEGWEYQRAETLPSVERSGLTGSTTEWRNLLVFRRAEPTEAFAPELLPPPDPLETAPTARVQSDDAPAEERAPLAQGDARKEPPVSKAGTPPAGDDDGVENASDVKDMSATLTSLAAHRNKDKPDS